MMLPCVVEHNENDLEKKKDTRTSIDRRSSQADREKPVQRREHTKVWSVYGRFKGERDEEKERRKRRGF